MINVILANVTINFNIFTMYSMLNLSDGHMFPIGFNLKKKFQVIKIYSNYLRWIRNVVSIISKRAIIIQDLLLLHLIFEYFNFSTYLLAFLCLKFYFQINYTISNHNL